MILYHGSYIPIEQPKILIQEKGRDFGFGFYTTTIKEQAERWAIRTARLRSRLSDKNENAIERLSFEKINDQICFCTEEALKSITFKKGYIVKSVNWRDY